MKTETLNIESLIPYAKNSRTHSAEQVAQIASSIREFGWTNPVLIDGQGTIIAGHGRVMAARALNIVEIPCIRLTHLSESQVRAYVIADNKLALNAGWDDEMLNSELRALAEEGDIVKMTGFSDEELAALLEPETELNGDPDEVPELPVEPITKVGDLWTLGEHRVLCGDSTKADDVERLMAGVEADLIWTDPPYGVNHIGGTKDPRRKTHRTGGVVHNDDKTGEDLVVMVSKAIGAIPRHESTVLYVASPPGSNLREMIDAFNTAGFEFRHSLVWVKHAFVFGRADYHYRHELILYGWGKRHEWTGERNISTVFEFPRGDKTVDHPTSKPVGLIAATSKNHPAEIMADPFCGSGSTLIAAEQLGRKCYGMEISPAYCDVIVNRWQNLTGKTATHAVTGKPFNDRPAA